MVAQPNIETTPIDWDALDALAVKHLDTTLDLLLGRVGIKSRDDFERLAQGDHVEALKYLGNAIALWRLTVRVYVAETRQTRNSAFYLSLDYGFARVSIFAKSVNAIFRNTAHLINDWRTIGYQYGFRPYINVRLSIDRNGYPVVDRLKDPEIMNEDQPIPEIHENLKAFIDRRYATMPADDSAKMLHEYARTLHFFYGHAEQQDDTSGWIAPPVIPGTMIDGFHQIDYVLLSGFLESRWQKIDATTNEKQYRITEQGCIMLGRAYPVQKDQLGKLLALDDDGEADAAGDEPAAGDDPAAELTLDPDAVEAAQESNTWIREQFEEAATPAAEASTPDSDDDEPEAEPVDDLVEWAKFVNGQAPQIEVKTLIQPLNGTTAAADKALAEHLNDCWAVINLTVTTINDDSGDWSVPYTTRIVTLQRTSSQPAGKSRASAYVPARQPRQMVTPDSDPVVIPVHGTANNAPLNALIETLPVASALRREGPATVRDAMNAEAIEAGQQAFTAALESYPRRRITAIPASVGASS